MGSEFTKTLIVDGDGNGDATTIQAAITALGGNGGVIIVEEYDNSGDYYEITSTIDIPDNLTIIGRGNVVLNVISDVILFRNKGQTGTPITGNSRIVLSGFKIQVNITSGNYTKDLIYFKGVKNSIIEKVTIFVESGTVGSSCTAMRLEGYDSSCDYCSSAGNVIAECNIQNFGYGILLQGQSSGYPNSEENMVQNNTVSNCATSNIALSYAPYNIISNNVLSDSSSHGLYVSDISNYTSIMGNEVFSNENTGIEIYQSSGCSIQGNVCKSNTEDGININGTSSYPAEYNAVVGNTCYENRGSQQPPMSGNGISLDNYAKRNVVNGNTCYHNGIDGINEESKGNGAEKNIILGNVCYANESEQINFILVDGEILTGSIIANNTTT